MKVLKKEMDLCGLCGDRFDSTPGFAVGSPVWKHYDPEVIGDTGIFDEAGAICPKCFREKLAPWLREKLGMEHEKE
jgi:hypothetical protein